MGNETVSCSDGICATYGEISVEFIGIPKKEYDDLESKLAAHAAANAELVDAVQIRDKALELAIKNIHCIDCDQASNGICNMFLDDEKCLQYFMGIAKAALSNSPKPEREGAGSGELKT